MLKLSPVTLAVLSALVLPFAISVADAEDATVLDSVVVTAPVSKSPLTVKFDPKAPQQPLPAYDGAAFLKNIPGMSMIRKGGTDGDPVFRGMAGSRLGVLLNGQEIYGGCPNRMDPPTAYIYPESYDHVTLVKGPTVKYGSGFSAGVVNFERDSKPAVGTAGHASVTLGSAGRNDVEMDGKTGTDKFYIQGGATRADANDYKDGSGKTVHSAYTRWNTNAAMGWTPDADTLMELSVAKSDGKAAYADRSMDGSKFTREDAALKFERKNISPLVDKVEGQVYYNHIDHVMDNYSLRDNTTGKYSAMNPERATKGGRISTTLNAGEKTKVTLGSDTKSDAHAGRMTPMAGLSSAAAADAYYTSLPYTQDMQFSQKGLFGEVKHSLTDRSRVMGGLRVDQYEATDSRSALTVPGVAMPVKNKTSGMTDKDTLKSGFARFEKDAAGGKGTYYVGVGHTERYPDYWEITKLDPVTKNSALFTDKPEKTNQLDVGRNWKTGKWSGSTSAFYSKIDNYQLITSAGTNLNVKAETHGLEADAAYQVSDNWKGTVALSFVHADDKTRHTPLAQQPAHEMKLGAEYDNKKQFFGTQVRLASKQDRVDPGYGNIAGQDIIGPTSGFEVVSINGGTRPKKGVVLSAGIDNLFNKTYAENISKGDAVDVGANPQITRVNEPGRTLWVKATFDLK